VTALLRALTPAQIRAPFARYAHGVEVAAGARLLFSSGQLGLAPDDTLPDGAEAQAARCFANLDAVLAEAAMTRADVVRVNAYVTDRAHMAGYMAARDAWVADLASPPASTLMIVSGFTRPEFVVEIEIIAAAAPKS
jgi:enamine deaminase RidA (YjgF/YER057c/UK114 family)